MLLLTLPTELLTLIICDLGPQFFKEDLKRLTICRKWYILAQEELRAHVSFVTWRDVKYLLENRLEIQPCGMPMWASNNVQSLDFGFPGRDLYRDGAQQAETSMTLSRLLPSVFSRIMGAEQSSPILLLADLRSLRRLKLDIFVWTGLQSLWRNLESSEWPHVVHTALISISTLSLPFLRELNLILTGRTSFRRIPRWPLHDHTCVALNTVLVALASLKEVYLTLSYVCPALFTEKKANASRG